MIRPATAADLPATAAIYEAIFDHEAKTTVYTNWQRGTYPSEASARQALEDGYLYIGEEEGAAWGVVTLNGLQLPEYDLIPWAIPAEREQVGVIHTLCIHPDRSGQGLARKMAAFSEDLFRSQGKTVIRLDTWEHNLPANRLYPSIGYRFAGAAEFLFQGYTRETLNCYEKAL